MNVNVHIIEIYIFLGRENEHKFDLLFIAGSLCLVRGEVTNHIYKLK